MNQKYANAMAEVSHYFKGIRQSDIDKIPEKLIKFIEENASKNYMCNFDYNKPLNELNLLDETRGIIGMICYNYWCETEVQKSEYLKFLNENDIEYERKLREIYNPNDIFKSRKKDTLEYNEQVTITNNSLKVIDDNIFVKLIKKIKLFFSKSDLKRRK